MFIISYAKFQIFAICMQARVPFEVSALFILSVSASRPEPLSNARAFGVCTPVKTCQGTAESLKHTSVNSNVRLPTKSLFMGAKYKGNICDFPKECIFPLKKAVKLVIATKIQDGFQEEIRQIITT